MPNRILRDGILTSERVCSLSWPAEVFYRRLMSVVDDFGRYYAKPSLLRAACYPHQLDKVSDVDIGKWLGETQKAALVSVYQESGKAFAVMHAFRQQRRAKASKYPKPPCTCEADASKCIAHAMQTPADAYLGGDVDEGEDEGERPARKKRAALTPMPDGFAISDRVKAWAVEKRYTKLEQRFEHFLGYVRRKQPTYADWDEAFMSAVRDDWAKLGGVNGHNGASDTGAVWLDFRNCIRDQRASGDPAVASAVSSLGGLRRLGEKSTYDLDHMRADFDRAYRQHVAH